MRILICHPEDTIVPDLTARLLVVHPACRIHHVRTLTEAYNVTEHRVPDYLMIAARLAAAPEAELLFALAKLVGVPCIRLEDRRDRPVTSGPQGVLRVALDAPAAELAAVLTPPGAGSQSGVSLLARLSPTKVFDDQALILIGASTGGIDALIRVLRHWGPTAPPTLIVQHTGAGHMASLVRLLDGVTPAKVCNASDGEVLTAGHVYLARGDKSHLCLASDRPLRSALTAAPPVSGHCPSVDMLFRSAVPHAPHVAAAILTGMGRDGADGLLQLRNAGATTFGQDPATSVVYGMPRIAKERGAVQRELPLDKIGPALLEATRKRTKAA